jgi:signal transduction histidine kinase
MIDVTREKQLEKELHRGQRLELMGQLASGVAHDFNNLLAVVLTLTQLVQRHLPSDHAAMDDLQRITVASKQASGLAAQLMSLSRACPPATTVVDLNALASRTMQLLRSTLVGNLEVEMQLTSSRATVLADESQIQQVLMNLCLNARDAMPGGGKLLIRTSITPSNEVCLTVADSGVGIREELRDRIFEPFFTTKENGSGLGLAVVQQVVESYRGRIEVHSPPGEGTRFEIYWPLA